MTRVHPHCLLPASALFAVLLLSPVVTAQVCNVKVVTDANPDYSDLASMIRSATGRWTTPQEKCWALFYWNHLARRQTSPMIVHGKELTDPIRQFNDYGYTMCSTIAGMNTAIWRHMGMPVRFWDISLHTVSECFYDGRWHLYDNSLSAIYTLCDGVTIAGVEDIGRDGACSALGRPNGAWAHCPVSLPARHQSQRLLDRGRLRATSTRSTAASNRRGSSIASTITTGIGGIVTS